MNEIIRSVCAEFKIPGEMVSWDQIKQGNINSTYKVIFRDGSGLRSYLVQKVNIYVFRQPVEMMNNIGMVTDHILGKLEKNGSCDPRRCLRFFHTPSGNNYTFRGDGEEREFWRVCNFIDDSVTFDGCNDPEVLRLSGKAFGHFEMLLGDFDASKLVETIPSFHDTRKRLDSFFSSVGEDPMGRAGLILDEISTIEQFRDFGCSLSDSLRNGSLPLRVTHNDTKTNNVMYDEKTMEPLVVVDLDTVMPGLIAYDFGDACRFACNLASEGEKDLSRVSFSLERFRALAEGFLEETAPILTPEETESLATGCAVMALELAVRFLDDYMTGDKYFRIQYPDHNLVRGKCQLALFKDTMSKMDEMRAIIKEISEKDR